MGKALLLSMVSEERTSSKGSNTAIILKIFKLVTELQPSVYHKLRIVKDSKLFVASFQRLVFIRKHFELTNTTFYELYLWNGILVWAL